MDIEKKVRQLIVDNSINEGIALLQELAKQKSDNSLSNSLTLLESRFNSITNQYIRRLAESVVWVFVFCYSMLLSCSCCFCVCFWSSLWL